jgi:proline dehydrogenase
LAPARLGIIRAYHVTGRAHVNPFKASLRALVERAARSYVVGPGLADAVACATALARDGVGATLAYWNDVGEDPRAVCSAYVDAADGLAAAGLSGYVSIKLPALGTSPAHVDAVAARCSERGLTLHFDSLAVAQQAAVFEHSDRLSRRGIRLGCTLPARFGRSCADAELAVTQRLRVRVVKGQWEDPHRPTEPRAGFLRLMEALAGRAAHVAVATHDPVLAEQSLHILLAKGTPAELELLFGLPSRGARAVAARLAVPVRMYLPYGRAWLPYSVSAMRRNPKVFWWFLTDALRGHARPVIDTP